MPDLNPNKILNDFESGKLDKITSFNGLASIIESVQKTTTRVNEVRILDKIQVKNNNVFKFLEDLFISDGNMFVRTAALEVMIRNFPIESLPSMNWVVKGKTFPGFLIHLLEVLWWSENPLFKEVKKELYANIEDLVQERVNEGVVKEDALILVFMESSYGGKLEKINYDQERWELPGDYSHHFKVNKNGQIIGIYYVPHSDSFDLCFVPNSLCRLKHLEELVMLSCELEAFPQTIGEYESLKRLKLGFNYIESIPESIGKSKCLEKLDLLHNEIKIIPESIGNLTSLKELDLCENKIEKIPDSIGNLSSLEKLSLVSNNIKVIPESMGILTSLKRLNLGENKIEVIPEAIEGLNSLESLSLINNRIRKLPKNLLKLKKLKKLYIKGNQIKSIPKDLEFLIFKDYYT